MITYNILIDIDAVEDLKSAAQWYEDGQSGSGLQFIINIQEQINSLKTNPHRIRIRYHSMRCMVVKKYPFLIHFSIDDKKHLVEIFAIFHTSRNPKIWLTRIR